VVKLKLSKLLGAGVGFVAGSVLAGFLYSLLPSDIAGSITLDNFTILVEIIGAYLGYSEL
jgi:hypothetical protein